MEGIRQTLNEKLGLRFGFGSAWDIIRAAEEGRLPDNAPSRIRLWREMMITVHPQRWTDDPVLWTKELFWQSFKNVVKAKIVKMGREEGWKGGRMEGRKDGRGEGWKEGRTEGWKIGRMEEGTFERNRNIHR